MSTRQGAPRARDKQQQRHILAFEMIEGRLLREMLQCRAVER